MPGPRLHWGLGGQCRATLSLSFLPGPSGVRAGTWWRAQLQPRQVTRAACSDALAWGSVPFSVGLLRGNRWLSSQQEGMTRGASATGKHRRSWGRARVGVPDAGQSRLGGWGDCGTHCAGRGVSGRGTAPALHAAGQVPTRASTGHLTLQHDAHVAWGHVETSLCPEGYVPGSRDPRKPDIQEAGDPRRDQPGSGGSRAPAGAVPCSRLGRKLLTSGQVSCPPTPAPCGGEGDLLRSGSREEVWPGLPDRAADTQAPASLPPRQRAPRPCPRATGVRVLPPARASLSRPEAGQICLAHPTVLCACSGSTLGQSLCSLGHIAPYLFPFDGWKN